MTDAQALAWLAPAAQYNLRLARWWRTHPARPDGDADWWEAENASRARLMARDYYRRAVSQRRRAAELRKRIES